MGGSANLALKARNIPDGIRHQEGFKYYQFTKNTIMFMILSALFQSNGVEKAFCLMQTSGFSSLPLELSL